MTYRQIKKELSRIIKKAEEKNEFYIYENENGDNSESIFLSSFLDLDPCGKYHCVIVPNEPLKKCERFWESFHRAAEELGGYITSGEGDYTDVFYERIIEKEVIK